MIIFTFDVNYLSVNKRRLSLLTGAFGYFEVTHDIRRYCKAKVFEHVGKVTPIAVRFSTVGERPCVVENLC